VFVGPAGTADAAAPSARLRCFSALPQAELAGLMSGARLVIANGGSTLLQAIACGRACIAVPIAQDQHQRIQSCVDADVAIAAKLDAACIVQAAVALLSDESARVALARRASALQLADGIEVALAALTRLMKSVRA
jgi:spore coat polysaccharide biosynthesis predicted glycosyltransferase SpsG